MAGILVANGIAERDDALFVLDMLRPGDLFIDVGANIGFYAAVASGRGARVHAYEPAPAAARAVRRGAELNGREALVTVSEAACGEVAGRARFTTGRDLTNHLAADSESGVDVDVVTLDAELMDEQSLTMIKIDAEGHDLDVLRGGINAIRRLQPVVLVEIWTGGSGPAALLEPLGYRPYSYSPGDRRLTGMRTKRQGNMLLVPEDRRAAIEERLRSADRPALTPPSVRPAQR